jgi:hypothetical protein
MRISMQNIGAERVGYNVVITEKGGCSSMSLIANPRSKMWLRSLVYQHLLVMRPGKVDSRINSASANVSN